METSSKPEPLYPVASLGSVCPVCGKKSYSAAGIHPQCSMQLADAPRQAALAAKRKQVQAAATEAKQRDMDLPKSKVPQPLRSKRSSK